jgi:hypothetical protein
MPTRTLIKQKSISGCAADSPSIVPIAECVGARVVEVNQEEYQHSASGKHWCHVYLDLPDEKKSSWTGKEDRL